MKKFPYEIKIGAISGKIYAVFKDGYEAEQMEYLFPKCYICCFNGYENAFEINDIIWC